MDKRTQVMLVAMVIIGITAAIVVNRVAVKAAGLQAQEKMKEIADQQVIENWEVFFQKALSDLGREINIQDEKLKVLRLSQVRDRVALERAKETLAKYNSALNEFSIKVKASQDGAVQAYGRTYTADAGKAQLAEFASAVVDQETKVETLVTVIEQGEKQIAAITDALRVAREQMQQLQQKGNQLVREKSIAELKKTSVALNNAMNGLDSDVPLTGSLKKVNELLMKMQGSIDSTEAVSHVSAQSVTNGTKPVSIQEAMFFLNQSSRTKAIDKKVQESLQK